MASLIDLAEAGWIPDGLIRIGIRYLVRERLRDERRLPAETKAQRTAALRDSMLALHTAEANEQHYEVPTRFFQQALGPRLKYSACIYPDAGASLATAEDHTLALYAQRLDVRDGDRILDLGCGWGSFSLWMAQRNPTVQITSVSNSATQRRYIEDRCAQLGLDNLRVLTADVNELNLPAASFDKVISVEMFEHVRNYAVLLSRIADWLDEQGTLFVHIFCHRELLYPFEVEGQGNWMGRYFFTGGLMPAADTLTEFQEHLRLDERWLHDGTHYQRTARHWLDNMDANESAVMAAMHEAYGAEQAAVWRQRWRMFFMACEEMFAHDQGREWLVAHYRFHKI